ncbi:MAG: tRNA dihydrouridine synthase DusB [Eubacterium sp.]|jgi:tRNA-dihydrouridine synthase B|nr:tRNA dihydrouridine synthase DusB [Eubacterium sp.]
MKYVQIGNVNLKKTASLAPMAGVSDYAFRIIAKRYGASHVTGEMVSSKGICYSDKNSEKLLAVTDDERPMSVQLFGAEPEFMAKAAQVAMKYNPDIIDINAGCPVPKIVGNGAGAALMKDLKLLERIVSAVAKAVDIPVTLKIRSGWDERGINAVETAKMAESAGISAVTVHARTKTQLYSGCADPEVIMRVKQAVRIPVIGNGDVRSLDDCINMYHDTGCDLVMIGRAAYGNPWLFREINNWFEKGERLDYIPCLSEKLEMMIIHIELLAKTKGEIIGMKEARKVAGWYLKGVNGAAKFRNFCGTMTRIKDLYELVNIIQKHNIV